MHSLIKISQQTLWQVLGKIVTSLSTFIVLGIVARNYGEEGTGIFTLATTYLTIFYLLADFGFNAYVLKRLQVTGDRLQNEWKKLLGTRIIWSACLVVLAIGLLPFWPFATPLFIAAVLLGCFDILSAAVFATNNLVFQAKLRYDLTLISTIIGRVLGMIIFIVVASLKVGIPLLVFSYLLGGMIVALMSLYLIKKVITNLKMVFDFSYMKDLFTKSWPIALTLTLNVIYFRVDAFMISLFHSNAEVGIYNVAYSIFQSVLVLPTFIMNSYYPLMLKSFSLVRLMSFGLIGIAALGTLTTIILAPLLITILTGGGFMGSTQSLQILSLGFPAYFLSALFMWIFMSRGEYHKIMKIYALGLIFNLILNLMFIPKYSFMAASWITVLSEYLILCIQLVVLWFRRR